MTLQERYKAAKEADKKAFKEWDAKRVKEANKLVRRKKVQSRTGFSATVTLTTSPRRQWPKNSIQPLKNCLTKRLIQNEKRNRNIDGIGRLPIAVHRRQV